MTKAKLYIFIRKLLAILAALLALVYLFYLIYNRTSSISFELVFQNLWDNAWLLIIVFIGMIVNWGVEMVKWRSVTLKIQALNYKQAYHSIFIGILSGILTPNRIGELGGRLLYIKKEKRTQSIYLNTLCSISQLSITLIFGLLALPNLLVSLNVLHFSAVFLKLVLAIIILLLLVFYFRGNVVRFLISKFTARFLAFSTENTFQLYFIDRLKLLVYSGIRYGVFCLQFLLLLNIFISDLNWLEAFPLVTLTFLFTTVIPSGWISDLPVRTSFAFFIFEQFDYNGGYASIASVLLWIVNLFIPALLGFISLKELKIGNNLSS